MNDIDNIFNDFDDEECDGTYQVGDYVVVSGFDYGGGANGIIGNIVSQLIDKDDIIRNLSGLLYKDGDFIVSDKSYGGDFFDFYGNTYKRISYGSIRRVATSKEIDTFNTSGTFMLHDKEFVEYYTKNLY